MIRCCYGRTLVLLFAAVTLGLAASSAAQGVRPNDYGTSDTNYHYISAEEFQETSRGTYQYHDYGFWIATFAADPEYVVVAPLRLPTGALVDGYTVIYDDSHVLRNIHLKLERHYVGAFGSTGTVQIGTTFHSDGMPGVRSTWVDLVPDLTIDYYIGAANTTQSYVFWLEMHPTETDDLKFRGIIVRWTRQISPAPVDPTFPDVAPGYWAFQEIEALAASGITTGFPDGTFRPTAAVTRAQMATFLARALGLHWAP